MIVYNIYSYEFLWNFTNLTLKVKFGKGNTTNPTTVEARPNGPARLLLHLTGQLTKRACAPQETI